MEVVVEPLRLLRPDVARPPPWVSIAGSSLQHLNSDHPLESLSSAQHGSNRERIGEKEEEGEEDDNVWLSASRENKEGFVVTDEEDDKISSKMLKILFLRPKWKGGSRSNQSPFCIARLEFRRCSQEFFVLLKIKKAYVLATISVTGSYRFNDFWLLQVTLRKIIIIIILLVHNHQYNTIH